MVKRSGASVNCKAGNLEAVRKRAILIRRKRKKTVGKNVSGNKYSSGAAAHLIRNAMAALAVLVFCSLAPCQDKDENRKEGSNHSAILSPVTPELITPQAGNSAFLEGHGVGTQGYVCLPDGSGGASWTINNARPEATLFRRNFRESMQ